MNLGLIVGVCVWLEGGCWEKLGDLNSTIKGLCIVQVKKFVYNI